MLIVCAFIFKIQSMNRGINCACSQTWSQPTHV